ncbi:MAG TPA: leishmanolysin-related zinc metalloendopeptidase, partial [Longimicrobium sp.]|nr:leishmanolysin-related zinc metalloendopeptidase [Longimicrobium sp.]
VLLPPPAARPPAPLGVYEIEVSGIGTPRPLSSIRPARADGAGGRAALAPLGAGIGFEQVASSSFTEGPRGAGGQRYVSFTYRVRNGTGAALANLTLLMVSRAGTIAGTPLSTLRRFDGAAASPAIAGFVAPTGAVAMRSDLVTLQALDPDVLQVYQESEVAAIPLPGDVTGIFPWGYVVRGAADGATRTLPAAASAGQFDGVLTLAFRLPLQPTAAEDVFALSFQVLAVQDGETRLTESLEEAQDTSAVRRLRERAATLGATTVTVLAGSPAAAADAAHYPGQRQLCSVRTAGSAAMPQNYITTPAAYTRLSLLRPGESPSFCRAGFRSGTPELPTLNVAYPITIRATDRYGNLMGGAADTVGLAQATGPAAALGPRTALAGGQATVAVTYAAHGTSVLSALGARNRGQRVVEVAAAATVAVNGGSSQAAMAGSAVPVAPSVWVRDLEGRPLAGVPVTFAVTSGGGSLTGASTVTDTDGVARVGSWVLGTPAALNTLSATAAGASAPATFAASGCSGGGGAGYGLTLCYTTALKPPRRAAFEAAAARWQEIVTRDLPDVTFALGAGQCGGTSPAFALGVDDLLIFAGVETIDGPGGILGAAAPCVFRAAGGLPVLGMMRFDSADVAAMEGAGLLQGVILHEMGHVLGIGTRWQTFGLLASPSPVGGPAADTYFAGSGGISGFDLIGGDAYTGGRKVPVENTGPAGTINAHWREALLASELMTGYVNSGAMPLSQLTVRSLADLGYVVDPSKADPFFLTMSAGEGRIAPGAVPLLDDVATLPQYVVDANGRVHRTR